MHGKKSARFWDIVPEDIKNDLRSSTRVRKYKQDEFVFMEGEPFKGFFVVEKGKFKVCNINAEGKEHIVSVMAHGELIAAPPVFLEIPFYPATVQAMEDGALYFFDTESFRKILYSHPDFMFQFARLIMQHLYFLKYKMTSLALAQVKERVKNFLRQVGAEEDFIDLPIPKNQIALLLGTTAESLSRNLKVLEDDGEIISKDNRYKLT